MSSSAITTLEIGLLAKARNDKSAMADLEPELDGYEFSESALRWIWERMATAWTRGELAALTMLRTMIELESDEIQEILMDALLVVWRAKPTASFKSDMDALRKRRLAETLTTGVENVVRALDRGDPEEAAVEFSKAGATAPSPIHTKSLIDWDRWEVKPEDLGILTGIRSLDIRMRGAPRKSSGIIFGTTNMGKSILGVNFGVAGISRKKRVLHIDTENGENLTRWRYVSRLLGIPYEQLANGTLLPAQKEALDMWARTQKARLDSLLQIMCIGVGEVTLREVRGEVERLRRRGFDPDEIIFDSPDHLKMKRTDNTAFDMGQLYVDVHGWAGTTNAALWAVTQAKGEAEGKIATASKTSWSYDKARIVGTILSINAGLDEKGKMLPDHLMEGKRQLYVAKARNAPGRYTIQLHTDLARALIKEATKED